MTAWTRAKTHSSTPSAILIAETKNNRDSYVLSTKPPSSCGDWEGLNSKEKE